MASDLGTAEELAAVFARMSGVLLSEETVHSCLDIVAALAAETVPGSAGAGVTLPRGAGEMATSGATDPVVAEADALQYELDEGPCLTAWRENRPVRIDDLASDTGYPRWSPLAATLGLRAVLSAPLVAGDQSIGAMKVYSRTPHAFDTRAEHLLTMFAAPGAALLANIQSLENARLLSDRLRGVLRDRDMVAMSKGILMNRDGVGEAQAFASLVSLARREGTSIQEVVERLIAAPGRRG
ncbi:MAG TPA: GAF and ANTAR domain-containing protein [Sporichthya sp.]|nr:GAF and ANTAR domain-containing protein [Sporichthya sp.]